MLSIEFVVFIRSLCHRGRLLSSNKFYDIITLQLCDFDHCPFPLSSTLALTGCLRHSFVCVFHTIVSSLCEAAFIVAGIPFLWMIVSSELKTLMTWQDENTSLRALDQVHVFARSSQKRAIYIAYLCVYQVTCSFVSG